MMKYVADVRPKECDRVAGATFRVELETVAHDVLKPGENDALALPYMLIDAGASEVPNKTMLEGPIWTGACDEAQLVKDAAAGSERAVELLFGLALKGPAGGDHALEDASGSLDVVLGRLVVSPGEGVLASDKQIFRGGWPDLRKDPRVVDGLADPQRRARAQPPAKVNIRVARGAAEGVEEL